MSDHMAQKADDQIEGGLREQERLYSEIDQLKKENEKLKAALNVAKDTLNHMPCSNCKPVGFQIHGYSCTQFYAERTVQEIIRIEGDRK